MDRPTEYPQRSRATGYEAEDGPRMAMIEEDLGGSRAYSC